MNPCELVNLVGVLTCVIAENVESDDQLEILGVVFTQLGDSLITYSTAKNIICSKDDNQRECPPSD